MPQSRSSQAWPNAIKPSIKTSALPSVSASTSATSLSRREDILGDGVNIAARLQEIAEPGGIAISDRVHDDVRDRLDTIFADTGEQNLKNIARPVQVWKWSPTASASTNAKTADAPLAPPDKPSIAVLPFNNLSSDPEQEFFADGIVEDLVTALSRFPWLSVIARTRASAIRARMFP